MSGTNGTTEDTKGPGLAKGAGKANNGKMEVVHVPRSHIRKVEGFNVRQHYDPEAVKRLAASIGETGLNEPLPVCPDPEKGEGYYILLGGFTRDQGIGESGLRGTWPCIVHPLREPWSAAVLNMTGNTSQTALHPADVARRLYELQTGTYPTIGGVAPVPLDKEAICRAVGLAKPYVSNLLRAWKSLSEPIREEWVRRRGGKNEPDAAIPVNDVIALAKLPEKKQIEAYEAWVAEEAARQKRRESGGKAGKRAKMGKKGDEPEKSAPTRAVLRSKIESFRKKLEDGPPLKARELEIAQAKVDALRWAAGEISRLPLV